MHTAILVPGLGDYNTRFPYLIKLWKKDGIYMHIHVVPWEKRKESFKEKLTRLIKKIDKLSQNGNKISLIGTSAGGSLSLNAYAQRKNKIHKVITVSPRLLSGKYVFPSLSLASRDYPAFKESVLSCETLIPLFTQEDKNKIFISQSILDEVVPFSTQNISGVQSMKVFVPFHIFSIGAALTIHRKRLINFLNED